MDERLRRFVTEGKMLHTATHEPIDDEWVGYVDEHLVRAVEPECDSDEPGLAVVDELAAAEAFRIETAIPWADIEATDSNLETVAFRILDALLIRIADDLNEQADAIPGEGAVIAIERIVRAKLMNGFSVKGGGARNGDSLLLRLLVMAGKVDR
jgi:hypothetical protein